jgi:hypothetical protein
VVRAASGINMSGAVFFAAAIAICAPIASGRSAFLRVPFI